MTITPSRLWVVLFGVAVLAFAGCAVGALDCTVFKPVGLASSLGAAVASFFDAGTPAGEDEPVEG